MDDRRRGIVLVTVLWLIALLSALAMAASITFRGFAGVIALDQHRVQAEALLTAGVEAAVAAVNVLGDTPLDELDTTITLSTGSVRAHMSDEGGRIDIGRAPVELLAGLFRSVGVHAQEADAIAQAIVGWRKPAASDQTDAAHPAQAAGSPDKGAQTAQAAGPPDKGAQKADTETPFTDIRQLALIPGMSPQLVSAIAPLATVYGSATVNPLTAPAQVLAALPGVEASRARSFVQMRRNLPSDSDAAKLAAILGTPPQYLEIKMPTVSVVLTARLENGFTQAARAVVVPVATGASPYRVLVWDPVPSWSGD
jgi:general secretion pathway protein K